MTGATRDHKTLLRRFAIPAGGGVVFLLSALLFSVGASAQGAADERDDTVEEIVVTGSRIPSANLSELSPVSEIDSEEFVFQGTARVEDLARTIPQIWSDQNTGQSNGATGTATVNLRNLGEERTLVLINGRRMPAGTPIQGGIGADINQIPGALVDRVEILTGGASAAYGSDAVAGVVNFWLDDEFEGLKLDVQTSKFYHRNDSGRWRSLLAEEGEAVPSRSASDGGINRLALTLGGNLDGGRGNITVYGTWRKIDSIWQANRDYGACALSDDLSECFGSSTIPQGRFSPLGALQAGLGQIGLRDDDPLPLRVDPRDGSTTREYVVDDGTHFPDAQNRLYFPDANGDPILDPNDPDMEAYTPEAHNFDYIVSGHAFVDRMGETFNYGALNYYQRPDERFTFGSFAHYDITPDLTAFAEFMFMDDRSVSQIAPSGAFFVTEVLACDNAFWTDEQREQVCGQFLDNDLLMADLQEIAGRIMGTHPGLGGTPDPNFVNTMGVVQPASVHPLLGVDRTGAPLFGTGWDANGDGSISADEEALPIPGQSVRVGRRNIEGGNRQQDLRHTSFRMVAGVSGNFLDDWRYEAFYQYSEVSMENTYLNDLSIRNIKAALDAVLSDPNDPNSEVVCRSREARDAGCVPWNVFEEGGVTQEALDFLVQPLFARGTTDQSVASAYITGDLGRWGVQSPLASTPVSVALGVEHREENLNFNPDNGFRTGDGAGQGGATPAVSGGYDVQEFFVEASIPILEDRAFAQEILLDAGYRYSDYSIDETTNTFGLRLGWTVNDDVKLRTSFQRAVRAPNVRELFRPSGFNLFALNADPCAADAEDDDTLEMERASLEDCLKTGVTHANYDTIESNPAGQYNRLESGNLALEPEEADSFSIGVVYTPENELLSGLVLSLDYFQIEVEKGIAQPSAEFILNQCLAADIDTTKLTGQALIEARMADPFCSKVVRGGGGDLWVGSDVDTSGHVIVTNDNLAREEVAGIDVSAEYAVDLGAWGELLISDVMSILTKWDQQEQAVAPVVDCAGKWGGAVCGYPTPDFQNNMRLTWITPWNVRTSLLWRHIAEVDGLNVVGGRTYPLEAFNYIDLTAIWDVRENFNVRIGINNLFDAEPPIVGSDLAGSSINGNGNTFPGMYDAFGQYAFLAATLTY